MPTGKQGLDFFGRLVVLETQMKDVMRFQKWQMALLFAIFLAALKAAVK
jgi:cell division protein FtsL